MLVIERNTVVAKDKETLPSPAAVGYQVKNSTPLQKAQCGQLDISYHRTSGQPMTTIHLRQLSQHNCILGCSPLTDGFTLDADSFPQLKVQQSPDPIPMVTAAAALFRE